MQNVVLNSYMAVLLELLQTKSPNLTKFGFTNMGAINEVYLCLRGSKLHNVGWIYHI